MEKIERAIGGICFGLVAFYAGAYYQCLVEQQKKQKRKTARGNNVGTTDQTEGKEEEA